VFQIENSPEKMDLSTEIEARSSDAEQDGASPNRRKSGRAVRKPKLFSEGVHSIRSNTAEKRKRNATRDDDDVDDEEEDTSESEDDPEDEDPDEEEEKERRRATRKASTKKSMATKSKGKSKSSRAAKKPKTNGAGKPLPIRSMANGKKDKTPKAGKERTGPPRPIFRAVADGLYCRNQPHIFGNAHHTDICLLQLISLKKAKMSTLLWKSGYHNMKKIRRKVYARYLTLPYSAQVQTFRWTRKMLPKKTSGPNAWKIFKLPIWRRNLSNIP
jgi:hypothetical protein